MPRAPRIMRLTAEHVARVNRVLPDPGPIVWEGFRTATDDDFAEAVDGMLASRPPGPFWLFAYGSLIWRPETAFIDKRIARARGWHRRFCLGPDIRYRGSREIPGVMMALDRGGQCLGVAYALPEAGLADELHKLIRREQSTVPTPFPWRWIDVGTTDGPLRALTFAMNRKSARYWAGLSDAETADILAVACGFRGSMAEYLFSTVDMLQKLGIHDRNLWRLQELVAERIDRRLSGER
jgi:cation transport protein ChaC